MRRTTPSPPAYGAHSFHLTPDARNGMQLLRCIRCFDIVPAWTLRERLWQLYTTPTCRGDLHRGRWGTRTLSRVAGDPEDQARRSPVAHQRRDRIDLDLPEVAVVVGTLDDQLGVGGDIGGLEVRQEVAHGHHGSGHAGTVSPTPAGTGQLTFGGLA